MKTIHLHFPEGKKEYAIYIGENLIEQFSTYIPIKNYSQFFIITDKHVAPHFLTKLLKTLPSETNYIVLTPGEKAKTIKTLQLIWSDMVDAGCDRKTLVINLGGGVIGDMGGFAAATYMRGVDFVNIPTSLLAQVDESVGGKTGIDFGVIKNLLGTFSQPSGVIIDIITLETLPKREFISGFAEIIKCGIISDNQYFQEVTTKHPLAFNKDELITIITKSCQIKQEIVQMDEKETGLRKLVNYGHTIGHAIESLSLETQTPLLHGEAISIGMIAEARIAKAMGLLTKDAVTLIEESLTKADLPLSIPKQLQLARENETISIFRKDISIGFEPTTHISIESLLQRMHFDKKNEKGRIAFTLPTAIGKAVINQTPPEELIKKIIKTIL